MTHARGEAVAGLMSYRQPCAWLASKTVRGVPGAAGTLNTRGALECLEARGIAGINGCAASLRSSWCAAMPMSWRRRGADLMNAACKLELVLRAT